MTLFYYPSGRPTKCDGCDAPVGEKDERYWDRETKRRYCRACGRDRGGVPNTLSTTATNKEHEVILKERALVKCPLTGRFFPEDEMVTVYNRGMESMRISRLAADIISVQYWAKIQGLWTVPNPKKYPPSQADADELSVG